MGKNLIGSIQSDFEALNLELNEQCLAIRRGIQHTQRTGAIFAEHPLATSPESISFLNEIIDGEGDSDLRERASRLYYACIAHFIRLDLLMMDETIDQFLVRVGIRVDGETITFADIVPWIMLQHDFVKREMLREKALPLLRKGGELKAKIWEGTLRILREDFGYSNYIRFCEEKKTMDLGALTLRCRTFLECTDTLYEDHVSAWVAREMNRPCQNMSRYHGIYLLHLTEFDRGFPKAHLMTALRDSLEGLGIEDPLGKKLFIDLEDRRGKTSVSRCVPLRIPEEIHVTIKPLGGLSDYETVLHEIGHGLHFASTDPSLPYAYRHLPRSFALSECFGFLFQNLTLEPIWLATHTGLSRKQIEALRYYKTLKLLCLVRRYMGKCLFEHELFLNGDLEDVGIYTRWLERATGFVYESEAALLDLEDEFYSVDYLKAWIGEASLRAYLKENFGEDWFMRKAAGTFLVELWREGQRRSLDDLLRSLGRDPLDLSPLERTFTRLGYPP